MGFGSIVGNLTGGLLGKSDAEKAAETANQASKAATKKSLSELDKAWTESSDWLTPYLDEGKAALDIYKSQMGLAPDAPVFDSFNFDYTKMEDNPAYQWVRDQGLQAVDRVQAKNRMLGSGNRMAAITDYAQGQASTEYGNEFNRQMQSWQANNAARQQGFTNEMGLWDANLGNSNWLATIGANTANNLANLRTDYANARSNAYFGRAADRAAAAMVPAQEKGNFINNLIGSAGNAFAASTSGGIKSLFNNPAKTGFEQ